VGNLEKIIRFIKYWFQSLSVGQKRQMAIICTVVFAAVLSLSVLLSIRNPDNRTEKQVESERLTVLTPIPAEDIFLPDEPDFLPKILLDREQRSVWTEENASEYWQDPLRGGEEMWREKIEEAIDEFLENIP